MSNPTYTTRAVETERDGLMELALNLRWTWKHAADQLWSHLDPELWERTMNPWIILQTVSQEKLEAARRYPEFAQLKEDFLREKQESRDAVTWFQHSHP